MGDNFLGRGGGAAEPECTPRYLPGDKTANPQMKTEICENVGFAQRNKKMEMAGTPKTQNGGREEMKAARAHTFEAPGMAMQARDVARGPLLLSRRDEGETTTLRANDRTNRQNHASAGMEFLQDVQGGRGKKVEV